MEGSFLRVCSEFMVLLKGQRFLKWVAYISDPKIDQFLVQGGFMGAQYFLSTLVTVGTEHLPFNKGDLIELKVNSVSLLAEIVDIGPRKTVLLYVNGGEDTIENSELKKNFVRNYTLRNRKIRGWDHPLLWSINTSFEVKCSNLQELVEKMYVELDKEDSLVSTAEMNVIQVDSLSSDGKAKIMATVFAPIKDIKSFLALKTRILARLHEVARKSETSNKAKVCPELPTAGKATSEVLK